MYTFRIKFNRRFYRVNRDRAFVTESARGNAIECFAEQKSTIIEFGGTCSTERLSQLPNVLVLDVVGFTRCESGIFDYIELDGKPILGVIYDNKVYIVLNKKGEVTHA